MDYIEKQTERYVHHTLWDDITPEYIEAISSRTPSGVQIYRIPLIATCSSIIAGRQRRKILNELAEHFTAVLLTILFQSPFINGGHLIIARCLMFSVMPRSI